MRQFLKVDHLSVLSCNLYFDLYRYDAGNEAAPGPVSNSLVALENISDNSPSTHHGAIRPDPR